MMTDVSTINHQTDLFSITPHLSYKMAGGTAEELERFRRQWQEEVTARSKGFSTKVSSKAARPRRSSNHHDGSERAAFSSFPKLYRDTEDYEELGGQSYHDLEDRDEARKLGKTGERIHPSNRQEPSSALEHYERGVERESEGSLGDSLDHYRKAYKLDAGVDRIYKNKHFPPSSFKSKDTDPNSSNAAVTVPNTAHHSLDGPPASTLSQLLASYASLSIPVADPSTDASPPPPCPISEIPSEILMNILFHIALIDPASFARLSLVCRRLAYLVHTEDRIWRRTCLGSECGMAAMHYSWNCTVTGTPLPQALDDLTANITALSIAPSRTIPSPLSLNPTYPTYKHMFQTRPRLRFNGCYISTVNYIRPGGNTPNQSTWTTPVHIVTYYRYLRFFRDGTCASLLTTTEPADVVHHLSKENMHAHHAGGLPSSVMNNCLRGRWRLSGNPYGTKNSKPLSNPQDCSTHDDDDDDDDDDDQDTAEDEEGTLHIETEGADALSPSPKYIYKMMLSLKSTSKSAGATRNNKLAWMGYWSYNKLTGDWAEFGLRNDKAFFWSRVRSYGDGE